MFFSAPGGCLTRLLFAGLASFSVLAVCSKQLFFNLAARIFNIYKLFGSFKINQSRIEVASAHVCTALYCYNSRQIRP